MKLSGVILTHNEEENIQNAIKSLMFCDEIIVVDSYSSDKTLEAINNQKVKIFKRELNGDYSSQRNFALDQAEGEWVIFLDADEMISDNLKEEIEEFLTYRGENYNGALFRRTDFIWNRPLNFGETGKIKLLRLGRKGKGVWSGKVHEKWNIEGKSYELSNPLKHFPHKNISEFLERIDYYSDLRSQELFETGKKSNFLSIIIYPKAKFFTNYILKQGFRDGTAGFIHAILMSLHSFMVRGKLWQLWKEKKSSD